MNTCRGASAAAPLTLARPAPDRGARTRVALLCVVLVATLAALVPMSHAAAETGSSITLSSPEVEVGTDITIEYRTDQPTNRNWVAIYQASVPDPGSGLGMAWAYAPGGSGTVTLPLHDRSGSDLPPGDYRIEFLHDDVWERITDPVPFRIVAPASNSSIALSATELQRDGTLSIDYVTDEPHDLNWVGIYRPTDGTPDGNPASRIWTYAPGSEGTVEFAMSRLAPGDYAAWYLAQDAYGQLAGPVPFTVAEGPAVVDPVDPQETDVATDGVLWRETFDSVEPGTADGPEGWEIGIADSMTDVGSDDWRGWTFTSREGWRTNVDEMRHRFGRAHNTIVVADAGQFGEEFTSTLTSPEIEVAGEGALRLTFDSHYRGAADQRGVVSVSFDGDDPVELLVLDDSTVTSGYDPLQMNYAQDIATEVPEGAESAVFSWELTATGSDRYWGIDSVALHRTLLDPEPEPTSAWVVSDIQGHPHDLAHGLEDLSEIRPDADALLMAGDIVNTGAQWEWNEIYEVMDGAAEYLPRQTIAAIGNHERYAAGGWAANRDRFLAFAERDEVWGEYVVEGPGGDLPVLVIGQDAGSPPDVPMSEEQVQFLIERLGYWTEQNKQVAVITHFPLGDTVSASWIPWYHNHHQHNDRLTTLLGNYPNAIFFAGHTHYPAELGDWAVQRRTDDGHPDGFWSVNTLTMHNEWDARGESTNGITEVVTRDINRGLTLDSYGDRVVVRAYDFATDELLREVTIPNPLVHFDADVPGPVDPGPELPEAWDAGRVYDAGDVVSHEGRVFEAQWWTREVPGSSPWGSWMELGETLECVEGPVPAWTESMAYTGGERVAFAGEVFDAKWWTRNQVPGDQWGPWNPLGAC